MQKIIHTKFCKKCDSKYEITEKDLEFYDKISPKFPSPQPSPLGEREFIKFSIPTPTLCPDCRQKRRLSFRNERNLYKRDCDATGKQIISIYSPDKPYKVYSQDIWWWDSWDALDYWKNFDFSRSFFEQFSELLEEVPRCSILNKNSQNSDYTNICANNKDCYMLVESSDNENCLFSYWIQNCNKCIDSNFSSKCEVCYNIDYCFN